MKRSVLFLVLAVVTACGDDSASLTGGPDPVFGRVRIVNAFTTPVDILVDGNVVVGAMPAGTIDTITPSTGGHTISLRAVGSTTSATQTITATTTSLSTIAAVRSSNGAVATAVLDDTNSVVPSGATKLRVLHFAPNAGTLQVYRIQPDFQQPVSWQFPFTYQPTPTSLSAPFYQSTVGAWEVRVWQAPPDPLGWTTATVRVVVPLASGEKRTILILDKPGGGVRVEVM